ncbi:MAG: AMP-binding protein, partial [Gemmatimonadota bacterium]|nr:AMP-binding protein [Gemmatimonadota bacterium]
VVLTPDNLRASAGAAAERLALGPDDRWLASLSVAHVGGLALVTRALLLGSELVAYGSFDPGEASLLVDEGWITHASLVPTQLLRVLDHRDGTPPPPSFRCVLVGGAHAPAALVARALDSGWPVALTYGMTEMSSQVATAPPDLVARKPGSVGAPLDGTEVRVDAQGEILARGPTQARGFLGGGPPLADGEGWYHTGDLGAMDAEGHLHVTGRRSIRVVSGGVTVDPAEVEEVIRSHPAVRDVCVVGLPDPEWGERLVAVVVPVEGEFDEVEVDAFVRERLSPPKRPRSWRPVDDLPLNANGKVDRDRARSLVLEQPGHSGGPPME